MFAKSFSLISRQAVQYGLKVYVSITAKISKIDMLKVLRCQHENLKKKTAAGSVTADAVVYQATLQVLTGVKKSMEATRVAGMMSGSSCPQAGM